MAGQVWDEDIGPLIVQYWATIEKIVTVGLAKGLTNTQVQTIATSVMGQRVAAYGLANSVHITCAADLAANSWS